jgi:dTDP-4-dehydrorhamnose 3,5-epimerase-like enzyme
MKREKLRVNFKDKRGSIMDILVGVPFEHCVIIYCNKGAVRGNHFHKYSAQSDFILFGKMQVFSRKPGSKKIEKFVVSQNDLTYWGKGEAHEFITLEKCAFLSFINGPRGGDKYETDTFHLKIPLHEQIKRKITDWSIK